MGALIVKRWISKLFCFCKNILLTSYRISFQTNRWIVLSELTTMLLGWSSESKQLAPTLAILHRLLVNHWVDFKIKLLVYYIPKWLSPIYISDPVEPYALRGSCYKLASGYSHGHPMGWNRMTITHSAVQHQMYGSIWLTVWILAQRLMASSILFLFVKFCLITSFSGHPWCHLQREFGSSWQQSISAQKKGCNVCHIYMKKRDIPLRSGLKCLETQF